MMRTPDGTRKLELVKYHAPADNNEPHPLPANRLGFRHIAIEVNDLNTIVDGLRETRASTRSARSAITGTSIGSATSAVLKD